MTNLPPYGFAANQLWYALVELALVLTAWCQLLALGEHEARRWEPKRLRLRLFTIPATLIRSGRRVWLRSAEPSPRDNGPSVTPACQNRPQVLILKASQRLPTGRRKNEATN